MSGNPAKFRSCRVGVTVGGMLISTMNDLRGHEIEEVLGEVFGLSVRSRCASLLGSTFGA